MRLRDAIVKRSGGRVFLHHLRSSYYVEVNDAALAALKASLENPPGDGPGRKLIEKLAAKGMLEEASFVPLAERNSSELVSLEIEPVGRCNLECGHCFVDFSDAMMTESTFQAVLQGAELLGAVELTFNGGEPLLNRRCIDWIEVAAGRGLRTLLFTNGTLVSAAAARRLAKGGLAKATVSLDGFETEHDALRGAGAWERATRGVQHLVAADIPVHVTTMVHPRNEPRLAEFHQWCRKTLGVTGVRVSTIAEMGRAAHRPDLQLRSERFQRVYREEPERRPSTRQGHLPCQAGIDKLYVSARGEVHGCHLFEGVAAPLGNLRQESLETIYAVLGRRPAGAMLRAFDVERLRDCAACPALEKCRGGCRARAWSMTGNGWGVDPVSCRKFGVARPQADSALVG